MELAQTFKQITRTVDHVATRVLLVLHVATEVADLPNLPPMLYKIPSFSQVLLIRVSTPLHHTGVSVGPSLSQIAAAHFHSVSIALASPPESRPGCISSSARRMGSTHTRAPYHRHSPASCQDGHIASSSRQASSTLLTLVPLHMPLMVSSFSNLSPSIPLMLRLIPSLCR